MTRVGVAEKPGKRSAGAGVDAVVEVGAGAEPADTLEAPLEVQLEVPLVDVPLRRKSALVVPAAPSAPDERDDTVLLREYSAAALAGARTVVLRVRVDT